MALAVAVFDVQPGEIRFEQGGDLFGDVHAAVLAAGAADADGEVGAVAALDEGGQPAFQVGGGVGDEAARFFVLFEEGDDRRVAAAVGADGRIPVGVGQKAHVKEEIGIDRRAVFEAKGLQGDDERRRGIAEDGAQTVFQLVNAIAAGVEDDVGEIHQGVQQMAFVFNRFRQGARAFGADVQRVRAARFAVAAHEDVGVGGQKENLDVGVLAQRADFFRQGSKVGGVARIHGDRDRLRLFGGKIAHEAVKQSARQIVDAVIAEVFESVQRDGFACAGQAGDDEHGGFLSWGWSAILGASAGVCTGGGVIIATLFHTSTRGKHHDYTHRTRHHGRSAGPV